MLYHLISMNSSVNRICQGKTWRNGCLRAEGATWWTTYDMKGLYGAIKYSIVDAWWWCHNLLHLLKSLNCRCAVSVDLNIYKHEHFNKDVRHDTWKKNQYNHMLQSHITEVKSVGSRGWDKNYRVDFNRWQGQDGRSVSCVDVGSGHKVLCYYPSHYNAYTLVSFILSVILTPKWRSSPNHFFI